MTDTTPAPLASATHLRHGARRSGTETIFRATLALMLALGCVSFIEPSPYEVFFFLLIPIAIINGLVVTRTTLLLILLVMLATFAEVLALMPYIDAPPLPDELRSTVFTASSVYLWGSAVLFALIFSRQAEARIPLALKAYGFSCVFAGVWGILSYLNVAGIGDREPIVGRIAGPFKDPNVMGSYAVLGTLFFLQGLILGDRRWRIVHLVGFVLSFAATFLSFSRGSIAAALFSMLFLIVATYVTSKDSAVRRKLTRGVGCLGVLACIAAGLAFSNDTIRATILDRAQLQQDYDQGTTGRFGNQQRAIPMLMERPLGFGPHRFQVYFDLDSHNSYVGAFSSGGWLGGLAFLLIVLTTSFLALRLAFVESPYRRHAQVVGPALISLFMQALQIDIDHWRFAFLMIGMVWGMEAARRLTTSADIRRRPRLSGEHARLPVGAGA